MVGLETSGRPVAPGRALIHCAVSVPPAVGAVVKLIEAFLLFCKVPTGNATVAAAGPTHLFIRPLAVLPFVAVREPSDVAEVPTVMVAPFRFNTFEASDSVPVTFRLPPVKETPLIFPSIVRLFKTRPGLISGPATIGLVVLR